MKPISLILAAAALAATVPLAAAGAFQQDRVHADSFGNLVIHSPAGYKRIIVGQGEAATGYQATGSYYASAAGRVAPYGGETLLLRPAAGDCTFGAVLLQGRSYMYGLPAHVVPTPAADLCR